MGKRKSKTGKQKQAKAKSNGKLSAKKSSLGGVKISKGISSKFQQNSKTSAAVAVEFPKGKMISMDPSSAAKKKTRNPKKLFLPSPPSATLKTKANTVDDEQNEFRRQMASMQERQLAADQANAVQRKANSNKKKGMEFQPVSFSVEKSTKRLLNETMSQMQTMTTGNAPVTGMATPPLVRATQSWAAPVSEPSVMENNPFAVLENGEDSDTEQATAMNKGTNGNWPSLHLAPASFTLLPLTTPTPAPTPRRSAIPTPTEWECEIDPDL